MNIFINARFLTQTLTGVQRYAFELVKAFDEMIDRREIDEAQYQLCLLSPIRIKHEPVFKHIPHSRVGRLRGHLWEQFELPRYCRGGVLVNLCNAAPMLKRRQLVAIHGGPVCAFPSAYSFSFRAWNKMLFRVEGAFAQRVVTNSNFSRGELVKYFWINPSKISVIYLGVDHINAVTPDYRVLEKNGLTGRPYVLAVGSLSPHKNIRGFVEAVERHLDGEIMAVIAGDVNQRVFGRQQMRSLAGVRHIGYVNDSELKALYEHARCFVFPSFHEGFGLPPLEAMACGCPSIVSRAAALPETCGDAVLYCDPADPRDIADKIRTVVRDERVRATLQRKGLEHTRAYSWSVCARRTWAIITQMIADNGV